MADSEETRRALRRRVRAEARLLLVVAGPNGAGKSTFVETFLKPTGILVVNPDEVAKGLSPETPEAIAYEAARVADTWRRDLVARGVSFCMETVFSDPLGAKLDFLKEWLSRGLGGVPGLAARLDPNLSNRCANLSESEFFTDAGVH